MKFIDAENVCVKQRRAKLVLDLYELLHQTLSSGMATMAQWCEARGLTNAVAGRQDLYRRARELSAFNVELTFGMDEDGLSFEVDLRGRGLRALVTREVDDATKWLAARGDRRAIERLVRASVEAFTRANKGMDGFEEALVVHEAAARAALSQKIAIQDEDGEGPEELMSNCNVTQRQLRVTWTRRTGPRLVEAVKPTLSVEKAISVARSRTAFKVKLVEIGKLLDCSPRTAARFIKRVQGGPQSSERRV
jgi:hypothetical protein